MAGRAHGGDLDGVYVDPLCLSKSLLDPLHCT